MPLPTASDVADAVRTRWAADATLNGLVPAERVYVGRAAERTAWPYAVLTVEATGWEPTSLNRGLLTWALTVEAYCNGDPPDAPAIHASLLRLLSGRGSSPGAGLVIAHAAGVVGCRPQPGGACRPTGERRDAADVVKVTERFSIAAEADRGL